MSNPLRDMEKPDVIFCIGTNMTEAHPVAATRLKKAMARGAKLIVADPRRIPLAEKADVYLQLRVGTDVALLGAMAHVIARDGLVNREFVEMRTEAAEAFLEHVEAVWQRLEVSYPLAVAQLDTFDQWRVGGVPTTLVLDRRGRVVLVTTGEEAIPLVAACVSRLQS